MSIEQKITNNEQNVTSNEQRAKSSTFENSKERYFLKVDIQYAENLHNVQNDLPFLPERIKIQKVEKLVANLPDKNEYVIQMISLKQALNHRLVLKKLHIVIEFN